MDSFEHLVAHISPARVRITKNVNHTQHDRRIATGLPAVTPITHSKFKRSFMVYCNTI